VRRAIALAGALGLLLPAAAFGQASGTRTAAVGGGSFNAAPLLAPGRYRDTILPNEFLYYGVKLAVGQRLHVRARIASSDWRTWNDAAFGFAINLSTPLRERIIGPVEEDVLGNGNDELGPVSDENMAGRLHWDFYGPRALPLREALEQDPYDGPGTWYVSFNLLASGRQNTVAEFPVEFDLELDGTAQSEPPDPTPAATATPTPTAAEPSERGTDDGGPGILAVGALGALGLAAGLMLGSLPGRRRRA
jgi:hypothetical protein